MVHVPMNGRKKAPRMVANGAVGGHTAVGGVALSIGATA